MTVKMTIGIVGTTVAVTENGKNANIVRARAGGRLTWEADSTVSKFDLTFFRVSAGDGAADLRSDWPFVAGRTKGTGADADEFEGKVTGAKWFGGRLESDASIFKYTITATPSGGGTPIVFDPQIIIDN